MGDAHRVDRADIGACPIAARVGRGGGDRDGIDVAGLDRAVKAPRGGNRQHRRARADIEDRVGRRRRATSLSMARQPRVEP